MAKVGLQYYNIDTDRYQDIRIKRLKKDCGCNGIAVYDYILCEIYRVKGCFLEWDDSTVFDVAEYFGLKENQVGEIVNYCCKVGLFDEELRASGSVLTSESIQRRYIEMCKRAKRIDCEIPEELRKIREEMPKLPEETPKPTEDFDKVKYSKVKKSKVKESILSLTCVSEAERERIFEIFFFKNFINPPKEVETFIKHYEANGWCRKGYTEPVYDKGALAETWAQKPETNGKKEALPVRFLTQWRFVYDDFKAIAPDKAIGLLDVIKAYTDENGVTHAVFGSGIKNCVSNELQSFIDKYMGKMKAKIVDSK